LFQEVAIVTLGLSLRFPVYFSYFSLILLNDNFYIF